MPDPEYTNIIKEKVKAHRQTIIENFFFVYSCLLQNYSYLCNPNTVQLVQLVEHQIVVLVVVGSSPTLHPTLEDGDQ